MVSAMSVNIALKAMLTRSSLVRLAGTLGDSAPGREQHDAAGLDLHVMRSPLKRLSCLVRGMKATAAGRGSVNSMASAPLGVRT